MKKAFEIAGRPVGEGAPVFIVAELSANHVQKKEIALRTIEAAAKAGADAIKLQTYTPDTLTLASTAQPFVVKTSNAWAGRTLHELYAEAMTPWEWHRELIDAAKALGLICFSTPFDPTAVAFLEELGVPVHKVASFELNDLSLVERIARTGKPVIMSTGMATLGDIEAAIGACRDAGNDRVALLRCVSSYPARPEMMDLSSFPFLAGFGTVVGLSDHTRDATVAIMSIALGTKIIEKHFILDRSLGGPDSFFSLEPGEFEHMVRAVRDAERALGKPRFGPSPDEVASTAFRRSLFVAKDLAAGEIITCDHVRSVRPANGLHPKHLPSVLGRRAARELKFGNPLVWEDVGSAAEPEITLRPATLGDRELLLAWRNDPQTRAMSLSAAEVSRTEHERWLSSSLDSPDRKLLVAELGDKTIGTVRLDSRGHLAHEVSLTMAPEHRGKGYSVRVLRAAERFAASEGVVHLVATIKKDNAASVRAFKKAGYYGFTEDAATCKCERRITDYR
jgi:N-acetylneuraminate synthase